MEIWKLGVPIRDAPGVFGETAAISKIIRKARKDARTSIELGKRGARKAGLDWDAGFETFEPILSYTKESSQVSIARMDRLLERLLQGDLVAVGIAVTATAKEPPEEIPVHLLERRFIKLNKDEIRSEHFHYRQVRIAARQSVKGSVLPPAQPKTKRGPKPVDDVIRQTYQALVRTGEIPPTHTVKAAWNIILPQLRRDHPDLFPGGRGLSYSSVARHIRVK